MTPMIRVPSLYLVHNPKETRKALRQAANAVARSARSATRSGSPPSAPGQPPAKRTGNLTRSIRVRSKRRGLGMSITSRAFYSTMLEKGAQGGGGAKGNRNRNGRNSTRRVLEPRPFMQPALEQNTRNLGKQLVEAIENSLAMRAGKTP